MKKNIKIELNEKELAVILAKHFKVDNVNAEVTVYHYEGSQREPSYTKLTFTAPFNN